MLWFGTVALLCAIKGSDGAIAGLQAQITQKGLDYGRQLGVEVLRSELQKMPIPDQSGSYNIPIIGDVKYSVSGMQIQDFQLPQSASDLIPGTGIKLSIDDAKIHITGNWQMKVLFRSDSGTFDLSVDGLSISAVLGVTRDDTGHPAVWDSGCSSNIGGLHVTFHGGASWLYNLFSGALEQPLRDQINGQLCLQVGSGIASLEQVLKTMPVSVQIDPVAEIDYSLTDYPITTNRCMDLSFKGEFYKVGHHNEPPFTPEPFSIPDQDNQMLNIGVSEFFANSAGYVYFTSGALQMNLTDNMGEFYNVGHQSEPPFTPVPFSIPDQDNQMLNIGVSEFFANSAGYVYFTSGVLQMNLTDNMIPKESPIRLNTQSVGSFIPELSKRYPNMSMLLHLSAQKQPILTCQPDSLSLKVHGLLNAFVILPNSTLAPVFVLQLESKVKAKVSISGQKIVGSLALDNFTLSLLHSDVGPFEVDLLEALLTLALDMVVIPNVNAKLREGFALPTIAHLSLVNPTVTLKQGYVLIGTDVQYAPK